MITWCDFFINFSLVNIFTFIYSSFKVDLYTANSYPYYTSQDYLTCYPSLSYHIFHMIFTIPGSCDKYPFIPVFFFFRISDFVTGILTQVIFHDSVQDYVVLEVLASSFQNFPELSLCYCLHMFGIITIGEMCCHNISRFFFVF